MPLVSPFSLWIGPGSGWGTPGARRVPPARNPRGKGKRRVGRGGGGGRAVLNGRKKVFRNQFSQKIPRALHVLNYGWWRLAVGGWWLAVGNWRLVAVGGGWRRLVVGDWWLVAVGSGWQLAVGRRWRLAAVGGSRLVAVGGWRLVAVGG